ncbi:MAG: RluA family pseudouridine synthase [Sutterellaceae bacterium]|nr:RluA family pseudouridine synthase [Burkholderiaceae bacterium]MCX7900944.1 RluA family pseudouridine synthase [Burkholderiaceae bacterium]MDW8429831.1 RluA family pseudouridine synthase [Sutterellaceae bacterium]
MQGASKKQVSAGARGLSPPRASYVTVSDAAAGQRLDNFLLRLARGVPKSHLYRIVRSGEVRVNGARARAGQRLQAGDRVRIPPLRTAERPSARVAPAELPPVLYEDEHILAVDKPAGLAAHGGSGVSFGLIERVRAARPQQPFLELVHRLDRETSGVLLLAKSRRALAGLHEQLRRGQVQKRYLVLVKGAWHEPRRHVRVALRKFLTASGERRVAAAADGQHAHTVFELRRCFLAGFALLEAQLKTGRTHQIRVHLAHLGYPIVGDDKYGDFALNKRLARADAAPRLTRMFLHAASLQFVHPITGVPLRIAAPLPPECEAFLSALQAQEAAHA